MISLSEEMTLHFCTLTINLRVRITDLCAQIINILIPAQAPQITGPSGQYTQTTTSVTGTSYSRSCYENYVKALQSISYIYMSRKEVEKTEL